MGGWLDGRNISCQSKALRRKKIAGLAPGRSYCFDPDCDEAKQVLQLCNSTNEKEECQWTCIFMDSNSKAKEESKICWQPLDSNIDLIQAASCHSDVKENDIKEPTVDSLKAASERLHQAADSLPAMGALVEVLLWPPNAENSSYISFLGSLRRLKDWHNAHVTIFDREMKPSTEFLHKFLASDICISPEGFVPVCNTLMWRGKLSVCDKIENSCVMIPGVSVCRISRSHPDLQYPQRPHQQAQQGCSGILPGRMLEVLDEVHLTSVPAFLRTPYQYKLCFYQKHSYCQVLLNYLMENIKMGLLVRLAVYPRGKMTSTCADVSLSTEAWKDSISADIQFAQEPEEELQDNYEFLYFLLTSPDQTVSSSSSSGSKFEARLCLLQHPYHLTGSLVTTIYHQSLVPGNEESQNEADLSDLPVLAEDVLRGMLTDLQVLQQEMLHTWIVEKKQSGSSTVVGAEELQEFLRDINMNYLQKLAEKLPVCKQGSPKLSLDLNRKNIGLLEKPYDWPERLIQQYLECQKRSLSRLQSSESVPLSSPLQPVEVSKTIDIEKFLKYFHPDGTASTELSPIRRRHPNRSHTRSALSDSVSPQQVLWPDCKDVATHDIYYNLDRKSEKINNHMNRMQEKYVKDETYSSCRSAVVVFPTCSKKRQQPATDLELRRSPRKRAPPASWDDDRGPEMKRQKVRGDRLSVLQEKEPKRRYSLPALPETNRRTSTGTPQGRRSESGHSGASQKEKSRRESDVGLSTSMSQADKKESRSERHKRKLLDIVEGVLIQHGLSREEAIFPSCSSRLFKVTKLFVMDLPTSRNLKAEMKNIAESQVKQVIEVDRQRQSSSHGARHKKKSV